MRAQLAGDLSHRDLNSTSDHGFVSGLNLQAVSQFFAAQLDTNTPKHH